MDQQIHFEKLLVVLSLHFLFSGNFKFCAISRLSYHTSHASCYFVNML